MIDLEKLSHLRKILRPISIINMYTTTRSFLNFIFSCYVYKIEVWLPTTTWQVLHNTNGIPLFVSSIRVCCQSLKKMLPFFWQYGQIPLFLRILKHWASDIGILFSTCTVKNPCFSNLNKNLQKYFTVGIL